MKEKIKFSNFKGYIKDLDLWLVIKLKKREKIRVKFKVHSFKAIIIKKISNRSIIVRYFWIQIIV